VSARASMLEALNSASGSSAAVMQRIVERAIGLILAADGASLELVQGEQLVCVAAAGALEPFAGSHVDLYWSLSGKAVLSDTTLRCDDIGSERRGGLDDAGRPGQISVICVPLRRGARPVGVLKVSSPIANAFSRRDASTLGQLAEFVCTTVTATRDMGRTALDVLAAAPSADPQSADLDGMSSFVAHVIDPVAASDAEVAECIRAILERGLMSVVLQPIIDLSSMRMTGAEALARFHLDPPRPSHRVFAEARQVGLGSRLQLLAVRHALAAAESLPANAFVTVNLDVEGMSLPELGPLLATSPRPSVIELTEEVRVDDYRALQRTVSSLRRDGARLAVDDTGAGYASLSHVLKLAPEMIKLDVELVAGIDRDPLRRSLVGAVVSFANQLGSDVVAEGIESQGELEVVRELGVAFGQGYLLGSPVTPELMAYHPPDEGSPTVRNG